MKEKRRPDEESVIVLFCILLFSILSIVFITALSWGITHGFEAITVVITACSLLGMAAVAMLFKFTTARVKKMLKEHRAAIKAIEELKKQKEEQTVDFSMSDYVRYIVNNNVLLSQAEENLKGSLRFEKLYAFLNGQIPFEDLAVEDFQFTKQCLPNTKYMVAIFCLKDYEDIFRDGNELSDDKKINIALYSMNNVLQEMLASLGLVTDAICVNYRVIYLLQVPDDSYERLCRELRTQNDKVSQYISEQINFTYQGAFSLPVADVHDIPQAYTQAFKGQECFNLFDIDGVLFFDNIETLNLDYHYVESRMTQMLNRIRVGNYEDAHTALEEVFAPYLCPEDKVPFYDVKSVINDVAGTLLREVQSLEDEKLRSDTVKELLRLLTEDVRIRWSVSIVDGVIKILCTYYAQRQEKNQYDNTQDILDYIRKNYVNPFLSVNDISEHFNYSLTYITKKFKRNYNMTIIEYIQNYRIQKAKELLDGTYLSIKDIAKEVGLEESAKLIRTFKKIEGITPGTYRELKKNQKISDDGLCAQHSE